jgi:hypothetical protein
MFGTVARVQYLACFFSGILAGSLVLFIFLLGFLFLFFFCGRRSIGRDEISSTSNAVTLESNQMEAWKTPTYLAATLLDHVELYCNHFQVMQRDL